MVDGENAQNHAPAAEPRWRWWGGLVSYTQRRRYERKARQEQEPAVDRAARLTAKATVCIAVFTVVLAIVGAGTFYEIFEGGKDTHDLAVAAGRQAELALQTAETDQAAFFRIDGIEPSRGDYWRVRVANIGKTPAPKFALIYSVIHETFPAGTIIKQYGPFTIERAEVLPTDQTKGTDVVFDFQTPNYTQQSPELSRAEEALKFRGVLTYDNGFKHHQISQPFCWQTFPWTDAKVGWDSCDTAKSALAETYKRQHPLRKTN